MADVFVSYASADRQFAERLAKAIADSGRTVWWDRHIKGGAEFSRDIEQQLDEARHVLVLWSKEAVNSRWVRDEAGVAADSGRLVASTIDGTPPPLGFRQFQTIDLSNWTARNASLPADLVDALDLEPVPTPPAATPLPSRRRLWIGIAAALALLIAALAWLRPGPLGDWLGGDRASHSVALAIMPFTAPPGADTAWLGTGLSGALNNNLATLSGLRLTSSTSTQAVAAQSLTSPEIGERLKVSHLVEGEVQKSGENLSIIVRLVEAGSSSQLWTRNYSGTLAQLPALQGQMSADLAAALQARLDVAQGDLGATHRKVDPRAYEAYLRGIELLSLRHAAGKRREALQQFRLASSIAPDFADAYAGRAYLLALSYPDQIGAGWPAIQAEQREATRRALQLDPSNLLAEAARLAALHNFDGQIEPVQAGAERLLAQAPDFAPANYVYASSLAFAGRYREAIAHYDRVVASDPFNQVVRTARMESLIDAGDYAAVRKEALDCAGNCERLLDTWYEAVLVLATPRDYAADYPGLEKVSTHVPPDITLLSRQLADTIIMGKPFTGKLTPDGPGYFLAALEAKVGSLDRALEFADEAAASDHPDGIRSLVNGRRLNFSPAQRADPRYHALFRHPKLVALERYRRKSGLLEGLPVFPVKPYEGR